MKQKNPVLSLVMINYNNEHCLFDSVNSILAQIQKYPVEFIIVDAGSTDTSIEILKKISKNLINSPVKIITNKNKEVLWINQARDLGINYSCGTYVGLLDSDCVYNSNWIKTILINIVEHEEISAFFGPRLPDEGKGIGTIIRNIEGNQSRKYLEKNKIIFSIKSSKIFYIAGSNFVIKKSILSKVHLYDKLFHSYSFEDVDLQERLLQAGHKLLFDPALTIRHIHPLSMLNLIKKSYYSGCGFALLSLKHPHVFVGKWSPLYDVIYILLFLLSIFGIIYKILLLALPIFILFTFYRMFYRNIKIKFLIYLPLLPIKALRDIARFLGATRVYLFHYFKIDNLRTNNQPDISCIKTEILYL